MKTIIPNDARILALMLTNAGYTKDNPLKLEKPIRVFYTIESPRAYAYDYPFDIYKIYPTSLPTQNTVVVKGREAVTISGNGKRIKWGKSKATINETMLTDEDYEDYFKYKYEIHYWKLGNLTNELFPKLLKPIEGDYYTISTNEDGKRYIHINGYLWHDEYWAHTEATWFLMTLEEFIEGYKRDDYDFVEEWYEGVKQYQYDLEGKKEAADITAKYFDGQPADALLPFDKIELDTPDGNYIHKTNK